MKYSINKIMNNKVFHRKSFSKRFFHKMDKNYFYIASTVEKFSVFVNLYNLYNLFVH